MSTVPRNHLFSMQREAEHIKKEAGTLATKKIKKEMVVFSRRPLPAKGVNWCLLNGTWGVIIPFLCMVYDVEV